MPKAKSNLRSPDFSGYIKHMNMIMLKTRSITYSDNQHFQTGFTRIMWSLVCRRFWFMLLLHCVNLIFLCLGVGFQYGYKIFYVKIFVGWVVFYLLFFRLQQLSEVVRCDKTFTALVKFYSRELQNLKKEQVIRLIDQSKHAETTLIWYHVNS